MPEAQTDEEYIRLVSSSAPFSASTTDNWVARAGGLPPYVRKLARGIMKAGGAKDLSSAISIALSRIKVWAAGGGGVNPSTRAKAAAAVADWEKARAKNAVHKLSAVLDDDNVVEYVALSAITSFNTAIVDSAWNTLQQEQARAAAPQVYAGDTAPPIEPSNYQWIKELGTDYIITCQNTDKGQNYFKRSVSVDDDFNVTFGDPSPIEQMWVEEDPDDLTADEKYALSRIPTPEKATANILKLAHSLEK